MTTRNIFTSDLHFFHKSICKFTDRPWEEEENTEKLIELWNDNVRAGDVLWHMGDFAFVKSNQAHKIHEILDRLNGQKRFLLGNHDSSRMLRKIMEERTDIISVDHVSWVWVGEKPNKTMLFMCHYPMVEWNMSHCGSIQLHGHAHGRLHNQGKSIDVGLDGANERLGEHRFWTTEDVLEYASHLEIFDPTGRIRD